jgi:hypothetical protein
MPAVMPTDTTRSCAEPNQQGRQRAKCDPVGIAVLRRSPRDIVADVLTSDTEEGHGYNPGYEGTDCRDGREESHKDCPRAVVARATQAKED